MIHQTPLEPIALWKQFLNLGEDLLKQTNSDAIMRHLCDRIEDQFSCSAQLYFAEPAYPLPGEPLVASIPSASAPELVFKSYETKKIQQLCTDNVTPLPDEIAFPLITQDTLLAILHVCRSNARPFTKQEIELIEGICSYAAVSMQVNRQIILKNWRYEQISLVRSVSAQISNVMDLDELSTRVTQLIQSSFNFYFVSIFTIEPGQERLQFRACSTEKIIRKPPENIGVTIGEGMVGFTAQTGKEHIARDVKEDEFFRFLESIPETRAEVTLPLVVERRVLGVLDIQSRKKESFHEGDMMVLRSLADNIALAVEGARLYNNLQKRADQLKAVLEINFALSSVLDLDSLLEEVVQRIHERFAYPFVHIFTVHPGRRKVIYHTGSGMRYQHLKANSFAYDLDAPKGLIPLVARTGKAILANDVSKESAYLPSKLPPHNTRSELAIPLTFGNEVLGVLDLQSDQINSFDSEDLDLFEGLAAGIAVSLRNANLFRTEKWRRQVADSFQDVAGLLPSNVALNDLLERVLVELEKTLPCDASAIWLLDENGDSETQTGTLRLASVHGTSRVKLVKILDDNPEVRQFLNDSLQHAGPSIRKSRDPIGPLGYACNMAENYSSISVPLKAGEKILGTLTLAHHQDGRYGSEASAISATFANYAAIAIQNASLYSSAQEEAWSSTVLLQVTEASQSNNSEEELLSTMTRLIPLLVGIDKCAVYLFDSSNNNFTLKSWYGFHPGTEERTASAITSLPFLQVITSHQPIRIQDPASEINLPSFVTPGKRQNILLFPLLSRNEILGALLVSHATEPGTDQESFFKDHTLAILQGVSQQIAVGLENIHFIETRQEEAYITAALLQVAQAVVSQNNLSDILDSIIHLLPILVGVETSVFYLWDRNAEKFLPTQVFAEDHQVQNWLKENPFSLGSFALLDEVRLTNKINFARIAPNSLSPENWLQVFPVTQTEGLEELNTSDHWMLGIPLSIKSEFYGVLLVCENVTPTSFPQKRIELLNGVAQQISLAIQDDHLNQEMIARQRVDQEIQLARQIQKEFLPEKLPHIKGWHLDLRWTTAREVGGDFYDVFASQAKKFAFVIADVSDKGIPASLYMTVARTLIHSNAQGNLTPREVLGRVNQQLMVDTRNGMFITAVFGILEPSTGKIEYSIAGHNLPLIYRASNGQVERLEKDGMALGVIENTPYTDHSMIINKGDVLLLYTDGVTETFSPAEEIFGEARLINSFQKACELHKQNVLKYIEGDLKNFRQADELSDDITMLSFQRKE